MTKQPKTPKSLTGLVRAATLGLAISIVGAGGLAAQSADEVIRSLEPSSAESANEGHSVRSVPLRSEGNEMTSVWVNYQYARDFAVHFASGQSELSVQARQQLISLGRALTSSRLQRYRYLIAGHTDAVGSPEYNRLLSLRRAEAVRTFLIREFDIDPRRLMVTGWGSEQLKDRRYPYAGVNRRVEIVLVTTRTEPPPPAVSRRDITPPRDLPCNPNKPDLDDYNRGCRETGTGNMAPGSSIIINR